MSVLCPSLLRLRFVQRRGEEGHKANEPKQWEHVRGGVNKGSEQRERQHDCSGLHSARHAVAADPTRAIETSQLGGMDTSPAAAPGNGDATRRVRALSHAAPPRDVADADDDSPCSCAVARTWADSAGEGSGDAHTCPGETRRADAGEEAGAGAATTGADVGTAEGEASIVLSEASARAGTRGGRSVVASNACVLVVVVIAVAAEVTRLGFVAAVLPSSSLASLPASRSRSDRAGLGGLASVAE